MTCQSGNTYVSVDCVCVCVCVYAFVLTQLRGETRNLSRHDQFKRVRVISVCMCVCVQGLLVSGYTQTHTQTRTYIYNVKGRIFATILEMFIL